MSGIVVGVDRSPAGDAALEWALGHAVRHGQPLTAVRAWTVQPYTFYAPAGEGPVDGETGRPDPEGVERRIAEEALAQAQARVPGSDAVAARAVAVMGASASALLEAAADADLLVVGSRGAGPLSRAVLGSVSASVLHHARCPVAVVPEPREDRRPGARPRVVVGVDHSEPSRAALTWAVAEARAREAVLEPVAVRELDVRTGEPSGRTTPELEASEHRALAAAAAAAGADRGDPVPVEPQVLAGHASAELLRTAEGADLLVLGSRGRGGFTSLLLGSTSSQCAEHATGPVVVVRGG